MAERRYELTYELTRQDWISFNETYLREGPEWIAAHATYRKNARKQVLWLSPLVIGFATFFIGRSEGYIIGAALGTAFIAFLYFALPRLNDFDKAKAKQLENINRMDVSALIGTINFGMDERGVEVRTPLRELKLSLQAVGPGEIGAFTLLRHGGQDGTIIPHRVFGSPEETKAFLYQAMAWWQAAQGTHAERLERYLTDRDCPCPKCLYNLRSARDESCPECGEPLLLETLISSPSS